MLFPRLFKKTSTDALQYWEIRTYNAPNNGGYIETEYGQVNTESPQTTLDLVSKGKNIGKKNETTALQQAEAEAKAKWEKQKKKGYVESPTDALAGEVDVLIEGGIVPMLAHKFAEQGHKIKYPAYVQPKLDGIRCIAILKNGKCTLWSRTRKPINSMPHIVKFIESNFSGNITFDGELYNHKYKTNFEKIVSLVRQEEPGDGHDIVQYHIYDFVSEDTFEDRTRQLDSMLFNSTKINGPLVEVQTCLVKSEDEVNDWFNAFKVQGYEGAIVRNAAGLYVNKRSYDLLKVKGFDDGEFDIIGVEEGRGKLQGHAGAFLCRMSDGKTFLAKMSGDTDRLKDYFTNHKLWEGKRLTVQYQGLTGKEGVPRFPVGIAIRDYE